jgi:integrase
VSLGLGAGLSTNEITALHTADIDTENSTVTVRGRRARTVTIEPAHAAILAPAISDRKPDTYAFCPNRTGAGKNLITNFVARGHAAGLRPNTQRMRATWIVERMRDGTSLVELMEAAGVTTLDALGRYVRFVG